MTPEPVTRPEDDLLPDLADAPLLEPVADADLAAAPVPRGWRRVGLHGPRIVGQWILRSGKRIAVAVLGTLLLLAGLVMLVLPGPGFLAIIAGFAVLATEFTWAERALDKARAHAARAAAKAQATVRRAGRRGGGGGTADGGASGPVPGAGLPDGGRTP